ncbi:MAG: hypothetical protein KKF44_00130 [Nanoarchaeota archaeon]|nr:hypothetical protein [Nanoarchaeota archaeon]
MKLKSSKKSQVAMESLMVYGIAILIVMLAIGALIYFGVLDLGSYLPDACKFKGGTVECGDYQWRGGASAGLDIEIINRAGKPITALDCFFWEEGTGTKPDDYTSWNSISTAETDIGNGEKTLASSSNAPLVSSGQKTKAFLACQFQIAGSEITRVAYGEMTVTVA